jgi:hypothetical protein
MVVTISGGVIRQRVHPPGAGDAETADQVALHIGDAVRLRQERQLDVAADQGGDHRGVAPIRDMHHLDAGRAVEHLGEDVQ